MANAPNLNRVDIPMCLKANYFLEDNEFEKSFSILNNLDRMLGQEDVYALLTRARIHYLKSVNVRHDPIEQSKVKFTFRKMLQRSGRRMQESFEEKRRGEQHVCRHDHIGDLRRKR